MSFNTNLSLSAPLNVTSAEPASLWNVTLICEMAFLSLMLLFNSFVLLIFIIKKELRTSFSVYIMALFTSNIIYGLTRNLLDLIDLPYPTWWTGAYSCTFYIYTNWVLYAVPIQFHMLISANRIWAITFPVSYRQKHTPQMALLLCMGTVAYVHALCLPTVVLDTMFYRLPISENGCNVNLGAVAVQVAASVNTIMASNVPILLMIMSGVVLVYKRKRPSEVDAQKNLPSSSALEQTGQGPKERAVSNNGTDFTKASTVPVTTLEGPMEEASKSYVQQIRIPNGRVSRKSSSHGVTMVIGLTTSIFLCWTPSCTYYTVVVLTAVDNEAVDLATSVLFGIQSVLDPIIVIMMFADLRKVVTKVFRKTCR